MTDFTKLASNFQRYFGELQSEPTKSVDKESLLWFAKTAARAYLNEKVPLNDSIIKIADREKDLNSEHLKRISEMANNEVFEQLFNNSSDKNVHFDVANTDTILSKVANVKLAAQYNIGSYREPPKKVLEKLAHIGPGDSIDPYIKDVETIAWHEDPRQDLYTVNEKLRAAKEELETEKLATAHNMKVAYNKLFTSVKKELRENSFAKIAQAMYSVADTDGDLNVLEDISYDLMKQRAATIDDLNVNPGKISPVAVNREHPVVENFSEYTKLAHYKNQIDMAIKEIDEGLSKTAFAMSKMNKRN